MNDFVYNIPPLSEEECLEPELQGLLEVDVSHLSFITSSLSSWSLSDNGKFSCCSVAKDGSEKSECDLGIKFNDTSCIDIDLNQNLHANNQQHNSGKVSSKYISNLFYQHPNTSCVQVKIVWFGERKEDAANLCISCETQQHPTLDFNTTSKKDRRKSSHNLRKQKHKRLLLQLPRHSVKSGNSTLRYRICTTKALLLDYLSSCKPIQVIVTSNGSASHCLAEPLGQAQFRLPQVLLKKFAFNIGKGHNFEHKTKIYTLYQKDLNQRCQEIFENYNNTPSAGTIREKCGEIQLRFRMLFAPSAAVTAAAAATSASLTTKHHTSSNVLHEKKLTSSPLQHHHHHHNCHHRHHAHMGNNIVAKVAEHVSAQGGDKSKRLSSQHSKAEEIVEAMKKLDAKLVAYLAGETEITSKLPNCEQENEVNLNLGSNNHLHNKNTNNNNNNSSCTTTTNKGGSDFTTTTRLDDLSPATKLNIFQNIQSIKLEMEALTLQPEGTKCMYLMQNEIRPIFTVECQLSNELIEKVSRHDMFHIMQFESEKFHSLTQCTRFGQEAERKVQLAVDENGNGDEMNLGRIYVTVWWREPGTCLNEMLGMGCLELSDLYHASLLEQCKRIEIKRRGSHLACLYFKIILKRDLKSKTSSLSSVQIKREFILPKQSSCDSGDEKSNNSTDKVAASSDNQAQQQQQQQQQHTAAGNLGTDKNSTEKASAHNKNTKIQTSNFDDETTKIRLLKGLIYANEARFADNEAEQQEKQKFLICRRFWQEEPAATKADEGNKFNYQEQFSVINDDKFLQRVDKQFLHLELWQRSSASPHDDGNGNISYKIQPMGIVNIPLHQFYIAYRDAAITNHLCKGKMPVVSIDAWAPILHCETAMKIGELKCLLAVGSDEQIKNLKDCRGITINLDTTQSATDDYLWKEEIKILKPLQIPNNSKDTKAAASGSNATSNNNNNNATVSKIKKTSDLLDMLQKVLMAPATSAATSAAASTTSASGVVGSPAKTSYYSANNESPLKPLQPSNLKLFKFTLEIQRALGLPLNPASKAKKTGKQRSTSKRFPPNEPPSSYVTFQADEGQYQMYKSHEGMVFATNIAEKTTQPQWQQRFRLAANLDYLNNPQKRFILKVWKKSALDMAQGRNVPTPLEDAILGFAALDLSVFARGLHIGGRFNIVDFNGRINGQLEIRCQPLDDIPATNSISPASLSQRPATCGGNDATSGQTTSVDSVIDQFEQTLDLTHLNLGQAIKRKFTELEGISQRLRARLGDVTGSEMTAESFNIEQLDKWQPLEKEMQRDTDCDVVLDEFENDLNTPPNEEESESQQMAEEKPKYQGNYESDAKPASE